MPQLTPTPSRGAALDAIGQIALSKLRDWHEGFSQRFGDLLSDPIGFTASAAGDVLPTPAELRDPRLPVLDIYSPAGRKLWDAALAGMTVYHGSPHKFDKFSTEKIGTGEGAQAYGHGLYFAENPGVAKGYQKNVKDMSMIDAANRRLSELARIMDADQRPGQYRVFKTDVGRAAAEEYDALISKKLAPGHLYKVDLPDEHIARMLDWDKPLSQQPESVRKAIEQTKQWLPANAMDDLGGDLSMLYGSQVMPGEFLGTMQSLGGRPDFGESLLRQAGVPGIRYLDAGSRAGGQGTSNFVVFDPEILKILERQ